METSKTSLGKSLPVPCVQELAKQTTTQVPPRYVRPDQDPPFKPDDGGTNYHQPQVPIIDLQKLLSSSCDLADCELLKLHSACKDWGFFQLINHGVSTSLLEKVKTQIEELFNWPMEEKKKFSQEPGELEGFGQAFVVSEEQKLDWGDMFYMVTLPKNLRRPNLFPKLPDPLRDLLDTYSSELKSLALKMLFHTAKALKIDVQDIMEPFEEGMQSIRMNYYPPCPQPELVMGITPHSDPTGLTILLQVNEVEGLQIKKGDAWVRITPLPNAFIINVGDALEVVTNGIYRSIEHRAIVNSLKERLSIATFLNPNLDGELGPAHSIVTPETPAMFKTIGVTDYFKAFFSRELHGRSHLDMMRIQKPLSSSGDIADLEELKLHSACKDWGFFQLINHGVSTSLLEKAKTQIGREKKILARTRGIGRFWTGFRCLRGAKAYWGDVLYMITHPKDLRRPNLFPKLPDPLRDTLDTYSSEMKSLALKMLFHMEKALKMDVKDMMELFEEGMQAFRMNYYPPCPQLKLVMNYYPPCPQLKLVMGLTPHSDASGLTILLQVNEVEGLQIKKYDTWVPITPLPNAFVINVGDALEVVINGIYRSIEHRAILNLVKERLSIATFLNPNLDGELGPAPSLVTPETPAMFKRIGVSDYYKGFFSRELRGRSYLDVMRIEE